MAEIVLEFSECSKDPDDCPVLARVIERSDFEFVAMQIDETDMSAKQALAFTAIGVSCFNGNCPGQDPELIRQLLEEKRRRDL